MPNILTALLYISDHLTTFGTVTTRISENRINAVGDQLEAFLQNAFAGVPLGISEAKRNQHLSQSFAYLGNQTNPPDMMLKKGDAIEVKKIQTSGADIALNSSYPKQKIYSTDSAIAAGCRTCEEWSERDLIYAVGVAKGQRLQSLWFTYGDCYAANKDVYLRVREKVKTGIAEIEGIEFAETVELGKIKKVDPLGITTLRMRGMWHIANPSRVFASVWEGEDIPSYHFYMVAVMRTSKYDSFPQPDRNAIESASNINVRDFQIKDPDNPAILLDAKAIIHIKND